MKWETITELAEAMISRGNARKRVVLTSETAMIVGAKLMTADAKPTRDEVAMAICSHRCERPCYPCMGKANAVVQLYGQRLQRTPEAKKNPPPLSE